MSIIEWIVHTLGLSTSIPPPTGQYKCIGVLPYRFPNSVFSKIFYPAFSDKDSKYLSDLPKVTKLYSYNTSSSGAYQYTRPSVIDGFSHWTNSPKVAFSYTLGYTKVPYKFLLEPISPKTKSKKFPVVIFSPGLGGNADIYSKFCSDIASEGYIVISLEHEDGSGSYAKTMFEEGKASYDILYQRPPEDLKYTRDEVIQFRKPFLDKRNKEITSLLQGLFRTSDVTPFPTQINAELETKIFSLMNKEEIYLAGHSFGGCTTAKYIYDCENSLKDIVIETETKKKLKEVFKGVVLLDIWSFPLENEILQNGIKTPVISILSERFYQNEEYSLTKSLLNNSNCKLTCYMSNVTHAQFSDAPWFTGIKYVKKKGALEGSLPSGII